MLHTMRAPRLLQASVLAAAALTLAACGGSSEPAADTPAAAPASSGGAPGGAAGTDAKAAALLPADLAGKELRVATNAPYPPFIDFKEAGKTDAFIGLDYDIVQGIAAKLGVTAKFVQQPFDGLVPGLQANKYDAIVGGITDNKERQATATFVDTSASGTGVLVKKGDSSITKISDLCGKQVAVQKAAKQVQLLKALPECSGNAVKVTEYPQNTDALQAVLAGKAQAFAATQVNLADIAAKVADKVQVVQDPANPNGYQASPNGIGVLKAKADLAKAMQAAFQSMIDDGSYAKILETYKQSGIGLKSATIDAAVD